MLVEELISHIWNRINSAWLSTHKVQIPMLRGASTPPTSTPSELEDVINVCLIVRCSLMTPYWSIPWCIFVINYAYKTFKLSDSNLFWNTKSYFCTSSFMISILKGNKSQVFYPKQPVQFNMSCKYISEYNTYFISEPGSIA